jgi:hypothetical protein
MMLSLLSAFSSSLAIAASHLAFIYRISSPFSASGRANSLLSLANSASYSSQTVDSLTLSPFRKA